MIEICDPVRAGGGDARVALRCAYAGGHFAKMLAWTFTDLLLAYYANVRVGLSARDTGLLLFVSMAQGAAMDVLAAYLLRKAEGDRRRILTIQLFAGLASAAALLLVFNPVRGAVPAIVYLVAALALFRTAFAFYDVAQNALVSLLPEDADDAHHYVVWRQALGALARLCVAGMAFLLVGDGVPAGREIVAVGAIAVLILLGAGWIMRWAGPVRRLRPAPAGRGLAIPAGLPVLALAGAAQAGPLAMVARMVTFVGGDGAHGHEGAGLLFAFVFGTLIGPLALPRPGRNGMRQMEWFTALTVGAAAIFLADPRSGLRALVACCAYGIGLGAIMTLFWRAVSAAIRDHAQRTGVRTDMAAFALLTATLKLAGALAGAGLGLLLDGFKAGDPPTLLAFVAINAAGGLCVLLAMAPRRSPG